MNRRLFTTFVAAALLAGCLMIAGQARADVFVVNSTADIVDANPADGVCATSGGLCTLRAAIQQANALPGVHEIELPAGVFELTIAGPGEDAAATGDLDILRGMTIRGAGIDATIIDGLGGDRVFHAVAGLALTIQDLTIRGGDPGGTLGGAVFHPGPEGLSVARVRFEGNSSAGGGAIFHVGASLIVTDCFFQNDVTSGSGGAINKGGVGSLIIARTQFDAETANGPGGAVLYIGAATTTIVDSKFSNCRSGIGGAVYANGGSGLSVSNTPFESNQTTGLGGAIYYSGTGDVAITNCTLALGDGTSGAGACYIGTPGNLSISGSHIQNNSTSGTAGGVYFIGGGASNLSIQNSDFTDNTSIGPGGGLYATHGGTLTLTNVAVTGNIGAAAPGGGLYTAGHGAATISGCRIEENTLTSGPGGGWYDSAAGAVTITNTSISRNATHNGVPGGGYYAALPGGLTMIGCTVADNEASGPGADGGGLLYSSGIVANVTNSTFSGNSAGHWGGGVLAAGPMTFTNCTLADNSALAGGGAVYRAAGAVTLRNTILTNSPVGGNCGGGAMTSDGSNIDSGATCALAGVGDLNNADPKIGPLQNNGGPTFTRALLGGSPAIDSGSAVFCPGTDQRGVARPLDGNGDGVAACDRGAFEVQDCDHNGVDDFSELHNGLAADCNHNGIPDACDIASGLSHDCDGNGVPDECQVDSDGNGTIDACEPPPAPAPAPCGVCAPGVLMTTPLMLLGLSLLKRRRR
jgi:large repetitive protein